MESIQTADRSIFSPRKADGNHTYGDAQSGAAQYLLLHRGLVRMMTHVATDEANKTSTTDRFVGRLMIGSVLFAALGLLASCADLHVSAAFVGEQGPIWEEGRDAIQKMCRPAEAFGNGLGALLILAALFAAGAVRLGQVFSMAFVVLGSGIAANIGKLMIARARPSAFFDSDVGAFTGNVSDSFLGWFPMAELGHAGQSFPSGHTAVAVALAICLAMRWPRARWVFVVLPILTAMQRISFGHHYLSDCLISAAIACAVAATCHRLGLRVSSNAKARNEKADASSSPWQRAA